MGYNETPTESSEMYTEKFIGVGIVTYGVWRAGTAYVLIKHRRVLSKYAVILVKESVAAMTPKTPLTIVK